jgi:protein-L-isoaspartate(D-aspartate) O-methyltransferase
MDEMDIKKSSLKKPLYIPRNCFMNNNDLIESLQTTRITKEIMKKVDRVHFCTNKENCYCDKPSHISMNQTISAPHMHAKAIEFLQEKLFPGASILDVGSGSGYLCACFAKMVSVSDKDHKKRGKVIGIDIYQKLIHDSNKTIKKFYPELYKYSSRFKILHGSGWDGYPERSKKELYDAIHVGASVDSIPIRLINQLKIGGILVIPLKIGLQEGHTFCRIIKNKDGDLIMEPKINVRYVPLIKDIPPKKGARKKRSKRKTI